MPLSEDCAICNGKADNTFRRVEVWSNDRWRLTTTTYKAVKGFCYLEPKRHIRYITELDGKEANEFGLILATVTRAIKDAGRSKLVYVYIYGDYVPHLHVHLAPHIDGDVFADDVIKNGVKVDESTMSPEDVLTLGRKIREGITTL